MLQTPKQIRETVNYTSTFGSKGLSVDGASCETIKSR